MSHLYSHQKKIVEEFPNRAVLVWSTGSGKSLAAIELAKKTEDKFLVIVPKALKTKWIEELISMELLNWWVMSKEEFRTNWDIVDNFPCVIVDESHNFFGTKSQMMKSLKAYFKKWKTPYRYFLTATPYRSSPMDIYVMADLLGKPMKYQVFFNKFFYHIRMGQRMIPVVKKGIEKDIAKIVAKLGSVVKLEDCVDMPDQIYETEYFSLTEEQSKAMREVTEIMPIVRYTKYHQLCGGTLKGDEYTESKTVASNKVERLIDLAQANDRLIVSCRYREELVQLKRILLAESGHTKIETINGDVTGEDRHKIISKLQRSRRYILLVSAGCAEGWELPECPLMVFFSLDFSSVAHEQMKGRINRINNIKKNTYIYLVVKDSIDSDVYECVKDKRDFLLAIYAKEHERARLSE